MVSQAESIKTIETDQLLQAIILEAKYIKKYWPKYNIKDRDDRSFAYVVIPKKDWSAPIIVRGRNLDRFPAKSNYIFGPYQSQLLLKNALKIIRRIFPYSLCQIASGRACFDYQIGLCPGACLGLIKKSAYQKNISNIVLLLQGKKEKLLEKLARENPVQAEALKHLQDVSLLEKDKNWLDLGFNRIEAFDISHWSGQEAYGAMAVLNSRAEADRSQYRLFKIKGDYSGDDLRALAEVLQRRLKHRDWPYPDLIVIDGGRPQINFLKKTFASYNFKKVVGISKLAGDSLVWPEGSELEVRKKAIRIKSSLLAARDEAHRLANAARRRAFRPPVLTERRKKIII